MRKNFASWKPSEAQNNQIKQFIKDLKEPGLDFTNFKIKLTKDQKWCKYQDICKPVYFTNSDTNQVFKTNGLKAFAYKEVIKEVNYEINKNWIPK